MISSLFDRTTCVAVTWTDDRQCRGVRMRRGSGLHVEDTWEDVSADGQPLSACLAAGIRTLQGNDNGSSIIVGPATGCGFIDLQMPPLPIEEMRNALRIEMIRQLPINPEKLAWGYRRLSGTENLVRLVYWRETDWQAALAELDGMGTGVDQILPPVAALDPLLAGQPVALPNPPSREGILLQPNANGGRDMAVATPEISGIVGADPAPLAIPNFHLPEKLLRMTVSRQQEFLGALLLAGYTLTPHSSQDRKTLFPIPGSLRVPRHRAGRMTALVLAIYLLGALTWTVSQRLIHNGQRLAVLRQETETIKKNMKQLTLDMEGGKLLDSLDKELADAIFLVRPPLTACLSDLSSRVPVEAWVRSLTWTDGKISLELTSSQKEIEIADLLKDSLFLTNIVQERKTVDASGTLSLRLSMIAAKNSAGIKFSPVEASAPAVTTPAVTDTPSAPIPFAIRKATPPTGKVKTGLPVKATVSPVSALPPPPPPPPPGSPASQKESP